MTADNAAALLAATGCIQLHASCSAWVEEPGMAGRALRFGPLDGGGRVRVLDPACVRALRGALPEG